MVKVLHILNSLCPSGAETMLKAAAGYWNNETEHHILVGSEELGEYATKLVDAGYAIHHYYSKHFLQQHFNVTRFINKNRFEIVHVHRESQALYYELDAIMGGAKRVVRTVHSTFLFKGMLRIRRIITRQLGRLIGVKHVAIGQDVYDNEKKRYFIKCIIINNWYDENSFFYTDSIEKSSARRQLNIPEDTFCLISVGNCIELKNHMAILKAIKSLPNNLSVLYLHVGKGIQESDEIEFINKNNLKNRVLYVGFQEPHRYLQASDLYVMPSYYEGVGVAALEAMAIGLPCLFTNVKGLKNFAKLGFSNVQYCDLSDESIAVALRQMVQRKKTVNSKEQSERIASIYGIQQGVMGYEKMYFGEQ